jgi:hypothetical protein
MVNIMKVCVYYNPTGKDTKNGQSNREELELHDSK